MRRLLLFLSLLVTTAAIPILAAIPDALYIKGKASSNNDDNIIPVDADKFENKGNGVFVFGGETGIVIDSTWYNFTVGMIDNTHGAYFQGYGSWGSEIPLENEVPFSFEPFHENYYDAYMAIKPSNNCWIVVKFAEDGNSGTLLITTTKPGFSGGGGGGDDTDPAVTWSFVYDGSVFNLTGSDTLLSVSGIENIEKDKTFYVQKTTKTDDVTTTEYFYTSNDITLGVGVTLAQHDVLGYSSLSYDAEISGITFDTDSNTLTITGTEIIPESPWKITIEDQDENLSMTQGEANMYVYNGKIELKDGKGFRIYCAEPFGLYGTDATLTSDRPITLQNEFYKFMTFGEDVVITNISLDVSTPTAPVMTVTLKENQVITTTEKWSFVYNNTPYNMTDTNDILSPIYNINKIEKDKGFYIKKITTDTTTSNGETTSSESVEYYYTSATINLGEGIVLDMQSEPGASHLNCNADITDISFDTDTKTLTISGTEISDVPVSPTESKWQFVLDGKYYNLTEIDGKWITTEISKITTTQDIYLYNTVDKQAYKSISEGLTIGIGDSQQVNASGKHLLHVGQDVKVSKIEIDEFWGSYNIWVYGEPSVTESWTLVVDDEYSYDFKYDGTQWVIDTDVVSVIKPNQAFHIENNDGEKYVYDSTKIKPEQSYTLEKVKTSEDKAMYVERKISNIDNIIFDSNELSLIIYGVTNKCVLSIYDTTGSKTTKYEMTEDDSEENVWCLSGEAIKLIRTNEEIEIEYNSIKYGFEDFNTKVNINDYLLLKKEEKGSLNVENVLPFKLYTDCDVSDITFYQQSGMLQIIGETTHAPEFALRHSDVSADNGAYALPVAHHSDFNGKHVSVVVAPHADYKYIEDSKTYNMEGNCAEAIANDEGEYLTIGNENVESYVDLHIAVPGVYTVTVSHDLYGSEAQAHLRVRPTLDNMRLHINNYLVKPAPGGGYEVNFHKEHIDGTDGFGYEDGLWSVSHANLDCGLLHPDEKEDVKIWFKPTDDVIDSPIMPVINYLAGASARLTEEDILNNDTQSAPEGYTLYDRNNSIDLQDIVKNSTSKSVKFIVDYNGLRSSEATVAMDNTETAVESVEAAWDAEVIYYDLQGNRVAEPTHGIYIKVVGSKASKIVK